MNPNNAAKGLEKPHLFSRRRSELVLPGQGERPAVGRDGGESQDSHRQRSRANYQSCVCPDGAGFAARLKSFSGLIGECLSCLLHPKLDRTAVAYAAAEFLTLITLTRERRERVY